MLRPPLSMVGVVACDSDLARANSQLASECCIASTSVSVWSMATSVWLISTVVDDSAR